MVVQNVALLSDSDYFRQTETEHQFFVLLSDIDDVQLHFQARECRRDRTLLDVLVHDNPSCIKNAENTRHVLPM